MNFTWIVVFVLFMMYRSFLESQKKQAAARRRAQSTQLQEQHVSWEADLEESPWETEAVEQDRVPLEVNHYQQHLDRIEDESTALPTAPKRIAVIETDEQAPCAISLSFDNESVVNGLVMSEILQPPRALRPFKR